ncbi:MAG: zinc-dependent alcohol dehydrogenase [Armatimonadota bacterium]
MKNKALFGKKFLDLRIQESDILSPAGDYAIVKVHACGVCGTDINFVRDWEGEPMPLGHEIAGEVVDVGKNVTNVKPGDKVVVEDLTLCGICESCKSGNPQYCRTMHDMQGQPGMSEYLSVRYSNLVKFDGLDYISASLTEPLAVCMTAVHSADIPLGGNVVILGNGPVGLMTARLAKLRGAGFTAITGLSADSDLTRARFSVAEKLGCDAIIQVNKQSVEDEILSRFPQGVDRVIVTSPPESMYDAFKIIRYGGIITYLGLSFGGKNVIDLDVNDMIFRKITLRPVFAEPAINFHASCKLLKEGVIDSGTMVTHTFGFNDAKDVMGAIVDCSQPIIKAVMLSNG